MDTIHLSGCVPGMRMLHAGPSYSLGRTLPSQRENSSPSWTDGCLSSRIQLVGEGLLPTHQQGQGRGQIRIKADPVTPFASAPTLLVVLPLVILLPVVEGNACAYGPANVGAQSWSLQFVFNRPWVNTFILRYTDPMVSASDTIRGMPDMSCDIYSSRHRSP